jgi:hypothetical protein
MKLHEKIGHIQTPALPLIRLSEKDATERASAKGIFWSVMPGISTEKIKLSAASRGISSF